MPFITCFFSNIVKYFSASITIILLWEVWFTMQLDMNVPNDLEENKKEIKEFFMPMSIKIS